MQTYETTISSEYMLRSRSVLEVDEGNEVGLAGLDDEEKCEGENDGLPERREGDVTTFGAIGERTGEEMHHVGPDDKQRYPHVPLPEGGNHCRIEGGENLSGHGAKLLHRAGSEKHEADHHKVYRQEDVEHRGYAAAYQPARGVPTAAYVFVGRQKQSVVTSPEEIHP